ASNVTVRNVITSMRLISDIDWAELVESVSLVDERLRGGSDFAAMDFATRNLYRSAIEQLARGCALSELEVTALALATGEPGEHLIAEGRLAFEARIGFQPGPRLRARRRVVRLGIGGYIGAILALAAVLLALSLWAIAGP